MTGSIAEQIIKKHLVSGRMQAGEEISVELDQCLLQDATGTMAWLEFEALGRKKVKPQCTQYIDHNLLQVDNKNMDDHLFLMSITSKYGASLSLPGNGISHHVHKERFTKPGQFLIGCDSHTPTSGGAGMIAIGVGGMDVAVGMATGEYTFTMPEIIGVRLSGKLKPWSTAKDVILELLRRVDVDGGKGKIFEFFGEGVKTLNVSERSTIANMGAETGATTTLFPSDAQTKEFFKAQKRVKDFIPLNAKNAVYDDVIDIDLSEVEPLIACPHSPGNVKTVREISGIEVQQAMIGSSTNSSYEELMTCAHMLKKHPRNMQTFLHVIPGSRQLLATLERDGGLVPFLESGARIAEPSCNACIGMGNAPASGTVSIRSFPRNWEGRSGTADDQVFLSSPETAVASALTGELTDPRDVKLAYPKVKAPTQYLIDDRMILHPQFGKEVKRGPNIKKIAYRTSIENAMSGKVLIRLGDDISTDHILPAGAKVLPFRSNIPAISEFVFHYVDPDFVQRAQKEKGGFIVAGENYGQGSSREHAAIAPMFLGVRAVLARSMARIHRANLINFGILPLLIEKKSDYNAIKQGHKISIGPVRDALSGKKELVVKSNAKKISCQLDLSKRERTLLLKGGLLNYIRRKK